MKDTLIYLRERLDNYIVLLKTCPKDKVSTRDTCFGGIGEKYRQITIRGFRKASEFGFPILKGQKKPLRKRA